MSGARDHQAAAGAAIRAKISTTKASTAPMTIAEPRYSWMPMRCSIRTGAESTKVKTMAIVTGSSSGRACSRSSTTAMNSRPRPSQGRAGWKMLLRGGIKVRPMMARPPAG
jgi:hypothetical protein